VDNTVTDDQYRAIAASHFETIRKYYPAVAIREYTKPKGDWNYVIYMTDLTLVPYFRQVEIYRSSFRNICSHHVGAVRVAYTSHWSNAGAVPHFYCTASAMWTFKYHQTPNYHYFAGRKSNPQDIIIKYKMRGIDVADEVLKELIDHYIVQRNIVIRVLPFYSGRNVPYSLFAAAQEYQYRPQPRDNRTRGLPPLRGPRRANTQEGYIGPPTQQEAILGMFGGLPLDNPFLRTGMPPQFQVPGGQPNPRPPF
jgi:hypothetical protein